MKRALAFLFQREGEVIEKEDFIYAQSVDLDWFSSDEARKMIDRTLESGLARMKDEEITANFDYEDIDIPMGFEPSKDILEKEKRDLFPELLEDIVKNSDYSKQEMISKANKKQDEMNIEIKTALLLVSQKEGIEVEGREEYIEKISKEIRGR